MAAESDSTDDLTDRFSINSDVEIGRQPVTGLVDADDLDDVEILGHVVWATTGDAIVPRDWLIEQFEQIPGGRRLIPNETWPSSAYKMAMSHMFQTARDAETMIRGYEVEWRLKEGDSGNYRHLMADITVPQDESGEAGGAVSTAKCATFDYDSNNQTITYITHLADEEQSAIDDPVIRQLYDELVARVGPSDDDDRTTLIDRAVELFETMCESHDGQDLRGVFYQLRDDESHAVPLRHGGAVYFFPAHYAPTVEGLARVWDRLNQYKDGGHEAEIATIPLLDNEGHREMVEKHAERMLDKRVRDTFGAGIERLQEEEEETAEQIAEEIVDDLGDSLDMAAEYSALLDTRLSVKRHLKDWLRGLEDEIEEETEELFEEVLEAEAMDEDPAEAEAE